MTAERASGEVPGSRASPQGVAAGAGAAGQGAAGAGQAASPGPAVMRMRSAVYRAAGLGADRGRFPADAPGSFAGLLASDPGRLNAAELAELLQVSRPRCPAACVLSQVGLVSRRGARVAAGGLPGAR